MATTVLYIRSTSIQSCIRSITAIQVVTQGILNNIPKDRYIEELLDETLTFPSVHQKVQAHFDYLRRRVQRANAENEKGIEADVDEKQIVRRRARRKVVCSASWIAMKSDLISLIETYLKDSYCKYFQE